MPMTYVTALFKDLCADFRLRCRNVFRAPNWRPANFLQPQAVLP